MSAEEQSTSTQRRRTKKSNGGGSPSSDFSSVDTIVSNKRRRTSSGLQQRFVDVFGWTILSSWAVGFTADMFNLIDDWNVPAELWGLMTIIAGAAFVASAIKKDPGQ